MEQNIDFNNTDILDDPYTDEKGRTVYLAYELYYGVFKNAVEKEDLVNEAYDEDGAWIISKALYTLRDGMEIELCRWDLDSLKLWDLSINKAEFDSSGNGAFLDYLRSIGVYPINILDKDAVEWFFSGEISCDDCYRIQFYHSS